MKVEYNEKVLELEKDSGKDAFYRIMKIGAELSRLESVIKNIKFSVIKNPR